MRAVITVIGKDVVGILAKVSGMWAAFEQFAEQLSELGRENGLSIHVMHEDLFNSMHRI